MNNQKKSASMDQDRIRLNETHEVKYWTQALGVSKEELEQVIQKVGNSLHAVLDQLGR
jgi:hypothetical protein